MGSHKKSFIKGVSHTLTSNLTSFIIGAVIVLIVPKMIGITEYGYFQYYSLLIVYAVYFHFGICDGLFLKNVGKPYIELNRELLASQYRILELGTLLLCFLVQIGLSLFVTEGQDKVYVVRLVFVAIIFVNTRVFSTNVLLATSRFKEYSQVIMSEKAVYILYLIVALVLGVKDYRILVLGDVGGKLAAALLGVYYCRDIVFSQCVSWRAGVTELLDNFKIGIFILVTNISSILIPSIIQLFVESQWDMETFGKVSLSFSISKMLMLVISAVSLVLLPFLKHMDLSRLAEMYGKIRQPLMAILIVLLLSYYPIRLVLGAWLPQYQDSLFFASLLFPMCLFESKNAMLISTYLKALRKERWLCLGNLLTVVLGLGLGWVTATVLKNLLMTVLLIPILFAFRSVILEYPLSGLLHISVMKDAVVEILIAAVFIACNCFFPVGVACGLYAFVALVYVLYHRKPLISLLQREK